MTTRIQIIRPFVLALLVLANFVSSTFAQEVSVPDPGLNAAIRQALNKPVGPLTGPDLLSLTNLDARSRSITNVAGLEAARNLTLLFLDSNALTGFDLPNTLTNLDLVSLSLNPLTRCIIPSGLTKLKALAMADCLLTNLTLPTDLTGLTTLDAYHNQLTDFTLPGGYSNLALLDLGLNSLTQCSIPGGLTNLDMLFLEGNQLAHFTLPAGLTGLTEFDLSANGLTSVTIPADMTNLVLALVSANQLTNLTVPPNLHQLATLDLDFNDLQGLNLPAGLNNLHTLAARDNQLTNLTLRADMTNLTFLDVSGNQLSDLTVPSGLSRLDFLRLSDNQLTRFTLPPGLTNLTGLFLRSNQLTNLTLAEGLTHLVQIDVLSNQLTSLTLPPDMTQLVTLVLDGNPLTTLVLSEPLAATNLAATVSTLTNQGVNVFTYPLVAQLVRPLALIGAFKFGITGPPGVYNILGSTNLTTWSAVGVASNPLGSVNFHDVTSNATPQKFYRAVLQRPPTNMVFIPPNTFTRGSPASEVGHQVDEGPQTMVTLTRGFWIGKYEVTQGEYLAVTGENNSGFPGDLNRPVETVSFFAASNYCFLLTAQDQASGRIPPGSHYRLPTEAEWECAARAGTSTRFSYGDDPDLTGLSNFAWFGAHNGITTHPVGQKLPNAWGLYDMAGNVWEWCQDWYGPYPGGAVTDPQGPSTNPIGWKVIRGGAWEASEFDCRSASRWFEGASPFISDFIIGFRVVLVTEP